MSGSWRDDDEVVEEGLELRRGLNAESLEGDESTLDCVDVLKSPTQLKEEEEVVEQFLGIDKVRRRVEKKAHDVMETMLLQQKTTAYKYQKRSHVIIRSEFV